MLSGPTCESRAGIAEARAHDVAALMSGPAGLPTSDAGSLYAFCRVRYGGAAARITAAAVVVVRIEGSVTRVVGWQPVVALSRAWHTLKD
jgi:hypothetical protein